MNAKKIVQRQYLQCIEAAEEEVNERLDRFRDAIISFKGTSFTTGQKPNFFLIPGLHASPFWSVDMLPEAVQMVLNSYQLERDQLIVECVKKSAKMNMKHGRTTYHGEKHDWLRYDLVGLGGKILEHVESEYPTWSRLLSDLRETCYLTGTYFAKMKPNSELSLHSGAFNIAIRMHFGLIIPNGNIGIEVNGEMQSWESGKWLYFDDTYPHRAWNRSREDRWILLVRLLHPDLTKNERKAFYHIEKNPLFWATYKFFKKNFFIKICYKKVVMKYDN